MNKPNKPINGWFVLMCVQLDRLRYAQCEDWDPEADADADRAVNRYLRVLERREAWRVVEEFHPTQRIAKAFNQALDQRIDCGDGSDLVEVVNANGEWTG